MDKKEFIRWHKIIQSILDHYLPLMSGKTIKAATSEYRKYFQVDYYCEVAGDILGTSQTSLVRPFDHLKGHNIVEYKSIHQVLNEKMFRHYVGRALLVETYDETTTYQNQMTLTILTTRLPETLLARKEYAIRQINDWKYQSHWVPDLPVYILVQKGMRDKQEGDALALLQVLEGEKEHQISAWKSLFQQNLDNTEFLRQIVVQINQETFMTIAEELKIEGKTEIAINMLREGLDIALIAKVTGFSQDEVKKLQAKAKKNHR